MLKKQLEKYNIILASGSPRRQQFFKDLDINFTVKLKDVEEIYPEHLQASEITEYLAKLKASAFQNELGDNELLITSDTIVWHQGVALGKPKDHQDAVRILSLLSDSTHEVHTSVCFTQQHRNDVISEVTKVTFGVLSLDEILYYLQEHQPYDKAGAYGIQDWIGLIGVSKIEGSYTNVMGMPTDKVFNYLKNLS